MQNDLIHENLGGASEAVSPVLRVDLTAMCYGETPVLGRVRLRVAPGETLAITGPSGIGKSTLLRIMAGLETRFSGDVEAPEHIGFVFQEPTLLPWRTAVQNITLITGVSEAKARSALDQVGLESYSERYPDQLSLGQQRRLSLARAFARRPDLLLMDEPFVSLDAATSDEIMSLFERLRSLSGVATILVTHADAEAARLADRVIRLEGTPAEILES